MALPWEDDCRSHSLRRSSLTCGVSVLNLRGSCANPAGCKALSQQTDLLQQGTALENESVFSVLDFSLPDNEYVFLDLKEKLSKYFSKDWKVETCRVSRGWRKEPGPSRGQ